jgi:hypothetical protein
LRDLLTGLAILLIIALSAALAGPYFVDWNARRGDIEARISNYLGAPVTIRGPIDLKLLPTPRLRLGDVQAITPGEGPKLGARQVVVEVSVMPLLRGDVLVTEALLAGARLDARMAPDGTIDGMGEFVAGLRRSAGAISIERLSIRDGVLALADPAAGRTHLLDDIDVEADAASLVGPWRATGQVRAGDVPLTVRLATGTPEPDGASRVKLVVEAASGERRGEVDGKITFGGKDGISFDGRLAASGRQRWPDRDSFSPRPWTLAATLALRGRSGTLDGVEFDAGGDDASVKFTGTGTLDFGAQPHIGLDVESRQIDFDRPFTTQTPPVPAPFPTVASAWLGAFAQDEGTAFPIPVTVTARVANAILGGDALSGIEAELQVSPDGLLVKRFGAALPGNSAIEASGDASLAGGGQFSGRMSVRSRDAPRLAAWLEGQGGRSPRLGDASDLVAQADVTLSPGVLGARNMKLTLGRSNLQGTLRYTPPEDATRGHFEALLTSDGLVIDQVLDPDVVSAAARGIDVDVTLDARNVRLGKSSGANVGAGRVGLRFSIGAAGIDIQTLDMADVAGASIKASGRVGPDGGRMDASVDAKRVEPLADILARIIPGRFPDLVAARAASLGPLKLKLSAERGKGNFSETLLSAQGTAAGTKIEATARIGGPQASDRVTGALKAESPEAVALLTQLGFDVVPLPGLGKGQVAVELDGRFGNGATLRMAADALGTALRGEGRLGVGPQEPDLAGTLSLESQDVGPLMQVLALPGPDSLSRLPAKLTAKGSLSGTRFTLADIAGQVAGQAVAAGFVADTKAGSVTGDLSVDRLALGSLAGLSLGPLQPPLPGSIWPAGRFGSTLPPPLDATVKVKARQVDMGLPSPATDASFQLRWTAEVLEFSSVDASYAGGRIGGSLGLRRQGGLASVALRLGLKDVALQRMLPASPVLAYVSGDFDAAGSGESMAALLSTVSGGGTMRLAALTLPRMAVGAVADVTRRLDGEQDAPDLPRVRDAVTAGLDPAPLVVRSLDAPLTVSSGVARLGPLSFKAGAADVNGLASLDLRSGRFDARAGIVTHDTPDAWSGPLPEANLTWKSPRLGAPVVRDVDVSGLTNVLTTHIVARELAKIEAAEADLRERTYFVRRLNVGREMLERQRQAEEEARQAEEARKAEEARRAEEERRQREAEVIRRAEEAKQAELARQAEEARKREEQAAREQAARDQAERDKATSPPPVQAPAPAPETAPGQGATAQPPGALVPEMDDEERTKALEEATRLMGLGKPNAATPKPSITVPKAAIQPLQLEPVQSFVPSGKPGSSGAPSQP